MGLDNQTNISSEFLKNSSIRFSPPQAALDQQLKNTGQFVLMQDNGGTGHGSNDTGPENNPLNSLSFLANPQTGTVLAQNGFKNLAMEIRYEFQPLVDKVAAGEMTAGEYAQAKADMYRDAGDMIGAIPSTRSIEEAKVVKSMASAGIKVICAEGQAANLKEHGEGADRIDAAKKYNRDSITNQAGVSDIVSALSVKTEGMISSLTGGYLFPNAAQDEARSYEETAIKAAATPAGHRAAELLKEIMEERIGGDGALADIIKDKVGNEKTAVYYGSAHGSYNYDLNEALGDTKTIGIYNSEDHLKRTAQAQYMQNLQPADGGITLDTGRSFSASDISNLVETDAPRMPQNLTPSFTRPNLS